jgi:hypothetical protein
VGQLLVVGLVEVPGHDHVVEDGDDGVGLVPGAGALSARANSEFRCGLWPSAPPRYPWMRRANSPQWNKPTVWVPASATISRRKAEEEAAPKRRRRRRRQGGGPHCRISEAAGRESAQGGGGGGRAGTRRTGGGAAVFFERTFLLYPSLKGEFCRWGSPALLVSSLSFAQRGILQMGIPCTAGDGLSQHTIQGTLTNL